MRPPRWTQWLLRLVSPKDRVDDVLGDLEEAHRRRLKTRGRLPAFILASFEALDMALAVIRDRLRDRPSLSLLDLKLGIRMLRKYPGLSAVSVASMAFGIAVGAVVFQLLTDLYFPDLGLARGPELVEIDQGEDRQVLHDFVTWRKGLESVQEVSAYGTVRRNLITEDRGSQPLTIATMNASGLRVTGVPPVMGRILLDSDEAPGAPPVLVIGYDVWEKRFGADPEVIGETVMLGNTPTTIVGVMPQGFAFPMSHQGWAPLRVDPQDYPRGAGPTLDVFGRLAPGVSLRQAQAELTVMGRRAAAAFPQTNARRRPVVRPYRGGIIHGGEGLVLGAYSFMSLLPVLILLLVAANVALLVFARTAAREREIAVRRALGASRGRVVLQFFAEALVLAGVAGAAGLIAADRMLGIILGAMPSTAGARPYWFHEGVTLPTVLYGMGFTLLGALVVGLLPALKAMPGVLRARLATSTAGGGSRGLGGVWTGVIVTQVAVTITLVPFVILALRIGAPAFWPHANLQVSEFVSASLEPSLGAASDAEPGTPEAMDRFHDSYTALKERLSQAPGVRGVTFATDLPGTQPSFRRIELDGIGPLEARTGVLSVDADYLDVFGIPLLAGRSFDPQDFGTGARVALVNEAFVRNVLGGAPPLGTRVRFPTAQQAGRNVPAEERPWYEIVGLVQDGGTKVGWDAAEDDRHRIILPMNPTTYPVQMAVHAASDPATLLPRIRQLAAEVDPSLMLRDLMPLQDRVAAQVSLMALVIWAVVLAGSLALLIANAGIYAALSFAVARQTREIGIRVALGSGRGRILRAILGRALRQLALGVGAGAAVLFLIMRYMSGEGLLLWGGNAATVSSAEAMATVLTYAAFMLAVCAMACVVPVRRALGVQPTEVLKADT